MTSEPSPGAVRELTKDRPADGAKPGDEYGKRDRYDFDADGRAQERETADVTIGGTVFHRRRKNWDATRGLRSLLRAQERATGRMRRLGARVDVATEKIRGVRDGETGEWRTPPLTDDHEIDVLEGEVDDLDAQIDAAQDESDDAAYGIIALLLRDDDGQAPTIEHLKEHLDVEDAGELAANLAGGGEPVEGPTPTETS